MQFRIRSISCASCLALRAGIVSLALLTWAGALRVHAAAVPSYLPEKEDVVRLDAVQVDGPRDRAYVVPNSSIATKTDTALLNVPQSITVITRELIDDQSMISIGDVSRYVPGMGIAQGEGNRDTPVLRGNSTTADFFVDGIRDDVQYFRDLYNVDRVEVLKGPNAMIFGRGGSGGVVNRALKQANWSTRRELHLQAGSWNQFRATLDLGQALNDSVAFRLTGVYDDSESYRDDVTYERRGFNPSLAWRLAPQSILRIGYERFKDERVADRGISSFQGRPVKTDPSTFFGDPAQSEVRADVNTVYATFDHHFSNGISLRNSARFAAYEKFYQNVFPRAVNAGGTTVPLSAYNSANDRDNWFNQTDLVIPLDTAVPQRILAGLELGRQKSDNFRNTGYFETISSTTTSVDVPLSNPRTTLPVTFRQSATDADNHGVAETVAIYAQDQIQLSPHFIAIAGMRFEKLDIEFRNNRTASTVTNKDEQISPRAGLVFKPGEPVSLYASYSMSFVPRAGEQLSSLSLTNRSLDPEEFRNYEVGLKWDYRPDLAFSAAVYQLDRKNVAITDPADSTRSILVDGQRAKGIELGATGRITDNWSIVGGYAYQDGAIKTTQSATVTAGKRLAQLPRHTFSLWNRYDFNRRWGVGLGTIYRGAIFASIDNTVTLPSFVRFDAAIFVRVNDRFHAQINVENILDEDYYASAHSNTNITPGSPTAFRLSLTARF